MTWLEFIRYIKTKGYTGDGDDFAAVQSWLRDNDQDPDEVDAKDGVVKLADLHKARKRTKLDLKDQQEADAREDRLKALEDELEGFREAAALTGATKATEATKAAKHDVKVGKERIEDDPNLGYPEFKNDGLAVFLHEVWKAGRAVQVGRPSEIPKRLIKSQEIMGEKAIETKAVSGLNEGIDSDGGFLVVPEQRQELLRKAHDTGLVFPKARPVPMSTKTLPFPFIKETSRATGSRNGGVRGYWVDEGDTYTPSKPAFGKLNLTAHKLTCLGYVTDELVEDSPVTLQVFAELFAEEIAFMLDDAMINGTGAGTPQGILKASALVTVNAETEQAAATILAENVINMYARMWAKSRANAVWFINQDTEPQLMKMFIAVGTGGIPVYLPANSLSGSPFATLLGRPLIPIEQAATLGTVGDIMLVDMSQYLYAQRRGLTSQQSIHVRFLFDETAFKISMRGDGQSWWSDKLTPFSGSSNTLSPFVALATRS